MLIIDSKLAIASVMIQSKQNIDFLEVKDNIAKINRITDIKDTAVSSLAYLTLDGESSKDLHNRLEIKIRTSEG